MKKILLGILGVTAIGLAGCSDDVSRPSKDQVVEVDQTRYLAVAISSPTNYMTRDDFEDGTAEESAVKNLYFVFYDADGNPTASHQISGDQTTTPSTDPDVTCFCTSVVPVNMSKGQKVPQYVMCFVNPVAIADLATKKLSELELATRPAVKNGNAFAMSNSVYYGDNPITGESNVRMMATPIVDGKLYATQDEAANALTTETFLEIYVERYAAKIGLTMGADKVGEGYDVKVPNGDGTFTDAKIKFTPEYWRPNAVDRETYVTKAFATSLNTEGTLAPPFNTVNTAFANTGMAGEGLTGWNDPSNFRSYWACSPSYYANKYPKCSDNITDEGAPKYDLKYFRYNELETGKNTAGDVVGDPAIKWNNGFTGYFYSRETTAAISNIHGDNGVNSKAVVASAIIVGKYAIETEATLTDADTEGTFYLYGKNKGVDVYYQNMAAVKSAMVKEQYALFTDATGNTAITDASYFEVKHPDQNVRTGYNETVAGRLVTLQVTKESLAGKQAVFYYDEEANNGEGGYVPLSESSSDATLVAANRLLWASASTAQIFYKGLAFFSVPIRHLGWGNNVDNNKPLLTETTTSGRPSVYNWENLRLGDLGVVRNHVYNLEITGISGLGVGLASEDQPMVPPMDPENYYVAARLNILAWRIVPTQSVTL